MISRCSKVYNAILSSVVTYIIDCLIHPQLFIDVHSAGCLYNTVSPLLHHLLVFSLCVPAATTLRSALRPLLGLLMSKEVCIQMYAARLHRESALRCFACFDGVT